MPRPSSAMAETRASPPARPRPSTLTPIVYGISLNFAEIGQVNTPSATDCKGASVVGRRLHLRHHRHDHRRRPAQHRPPLRRNLEPQLRRRHPRLHLLHSDQQIGHRLYLRQRGWRHQQSAADLRPSGGHQHRAGRPVVQLYDRSHHRLLPAGDQARSRRRPIWQTPASRRELPPSSWRASTRAPAPTRPTSVARPAICSSPFRAPPRRPLSRPSSASTRTASPPPISPGRC